MGDSAPMDRDQKRNHNGDGRGWSYAVGTVGVNRVTVFERGGRYHADWKQGGKRHRRSIKMMLGQPILTRDQAKAFADALATEIRHGTHADVDAMLAGGRGSKCEDLMNLPDSELLRNKITSRPLSGIYLLMWRREVVYVGQSADVHYRIGQHRRQSPFKWDAIAYVAAEKHDLSRLEAFFIARFNPRLNIRPENIDKADKKLALSFRRNGKSA